MDEDQQQFSTDDFTSFDGQNGDNEQQESEEQVEDGGDQAMETGDDQQADEDEDDRKIFVGGLSWETTAKDLREYFEKIGEVTSCTLKTDLETRKSRGFGFVVFKDADTVQKVLKTKEHKLHGRTIDPKPANPRQGIKKIFVGRLDPGVPEDDVKSYFGKFGTIAKVDFPFDKMKDQRRAFCFVEFESDKAVKKVLDQATHKLGGQEVDVKKATPSPSQMPGGRGGRGWGGGPGFTQRGGRGGGMRGRGGWNQGGNWNQGAGYGYGANYGNYGGYGQSGYGNYGGYGGYGGYGNDYYGYGQSGWGGYDQGYGGYGSYDGYDYGGWGYGQDEGGYGKSQKRGGHSSGGYHPYNR